MTALWAVALFVALLWPSHALSLVDGVPLDGRTEALLIGLAVPALVWIHGTFLDRTAARVAIVALLAVKIAGTALLTQGGLCATFSTAAPYNTNVLTIPIDEPRGLLRSWDVRADWRAESPACTAVIDRPYADATAFPAWFVNITDYGTSGPRHIAMDVTGYIRTSESGEFVIATDPGVTGAPAATRLDAGTHRVEFHATLTGDRWRLIPQWNGRDAFSATALTIAEPHAVDRFAPVFSVLQTSLALALVVGWVLSMAFAYCASSAALIWCVAVSGVFAAIGTAGRFERLAPLMLFGAAFVPLAEPHKNLRGLALLVGVPWLALIAGHALPQIGHFSAYSVDDWLAYQVAGYRIFMNGFWLEGGSKAFDYQALYRWISGAIHLGFGDSSVGEAYWDAYCLFFGACVAFVLVRRAAGFRWAVAAAAATLATFSLGTIWYFVGRGLSEVAAAGWGFLAALVLLRERGPSGAAAAGAGVLAVLMFYTRINHLLFAVFLLALVPRLDLRAAAAYLGTLAAGVALFATRTWWYSGVFSIVYGTSLKNNDTGLRPATLMEPAVWSRIWHSLRALVWMNEPPSPDPRALLVVSGVVLSVLALLQVPKVNRLPLSIAIVTLGACASSFLAHTHNYPGRMSIHLAPFAIAMTAIAGAKLLTR